MPKASWLTPRKILDIKKEAYILLWKILISLGSLENHNNLPKASWLTPRKILDIKKEAYILLWKILISLGNLENHNNLPKASWLTPQSFRSRSSSIKWCYLSSYLLDCWLQLNGLLNWLLDCLGWMDSFWFLGNLIEFIFEKMGKMEVNVKLEVILV